MTGEGWAVASRLSGDGLTGTLEGIGGGGETLSMEAGADPTPTGEAAPSGK
jgi:hypothetical protein